MALQSVLSVKALVTALGKLLAEPGWPLFWALPGPPHSGPWGYRQHSFNYFHISN